jgi:hypothetical protein
MPSREGFFLVLGLTCFVLCLGGGVALVVTQQETRCDDCKPGYNITELNGEDVCAVISDAIITSYNPCYIQYIQPGFAIGATMASICIFFIWVAAGMPNIIIIDP